MSKPLLVSIALCLAACVGSSSPPASLSPPPQAAQPSSEVLRRADADRVRALEFEVERLRADLRAAEETFLAVESGMRGLQGRAEAVSALAESRIAVERAAHRAPWRGDALREAREKLAEAERQLAAGREGAALFFVSRARRIAASLEEEARGVAANPAAHFVGGSRVNLRAGPSQSADVLATLDPGAPVFVEAHEADWVLVRTPAGRVGFVRVDLLSRHR